MDELALQSRLRELVGETVKGTHYAPPGEHPAILLDCVVIMGWTNGDGGYSTSHVRIGSTWATEGLTIDALRQMEAAEESGE
ncbi:hypothetical protein [Kocuria rosea]|uniref:hypothetical protein n=1 Tax=Kocuria rosea TaxID=1275 RepID=UPI00119CF752|nr:hypothetical protein [Kocuria rosea]